jgi:hypothetical protein
MIGVNHPDMKAILKTILDWSEVWALLIPLIFVLRKKIIPAYLMPVRLYVFIALLLNISIDLLRKFKENWGFHEGDLLWSNNFLYNTLSIVRFLLFSWFFILLKQRFVHRVKAILPFIFIAFVIVNFTFFEDYFAQHLSSLLLATEAAFLLFYCLQYFIYLLLEERSIQLSKQPGFWVVAGLSIYMAASFFVFLFYEYMIIHNKNFAIDIWDVHNITHIIFCICIARAFYERTD